MALQSLCVVLFPRYADWTMVFKVVGGFAPTTIAQLWTSPDTLAENVNLALDTTSKYKGHYKNRIVQNWHTFNPREVSRLERDTQTVY